MINVTAPRTFISYSHADGPALVSSFWASLRPFLQQPNRNWTKWDDHEILVGQDWDRTINEALEHECNCCLLLISDLFAKSSYIIDQEWPKTLLRHDREGILFFPVVFGVLEGGLGALPPELTRFQVFWPTVADLYNPPPANVSRPDVVRQCYKDVQDRDAARDRFLSKLAHQMNVGFDKYLVDRSRVHALSSPAGPPKDAAGFVTNTTDEERIAQAVFGAFSYEKRFRDSTSHGHYFTRPVDDILDERLAQGSWVLVVGHPLAGKTRSIFEALRRLRSVGGSFAVWPFTPPTSASQPLSLPVFPNTDKRILWLDDIDARFRDLMRRGYSPPQINGFLEEAAGAGVMLWATVRWGPTYHDFRHRFGLDDHLWDKLEVVTIPRIEGSEESLFARWYQSSFGETFPGRFDHHPGSLFLNLEAMHHRWENMATIVESSGSNLDAELAKEIMRALHVFYLMEAYGPGGTFRGEDIYFYVQRNIERRVKRGSLQSAFAKALALPQRLDRLEWGQLLLLLSQDQYHLGFLQQESETIVTETAYLDYIVGPSSNPDILRHIEENFSAEERSRLDLTITRYNFQDVFRRTNLKDENGLEKLARRLKRLQLHRNAEVWRETIALCPSFPLARRALVLMMDAGAVPNVFTFTTLVDKAQNYESARTVIDQMEDAGVAPDVFTFNTLMAKAQNYESASMVIDQMKDAGIPPDVFTFNTLMAKAQNYESARMVIDQMKNAGFAPDAVTFNTLMAKAQSHESASMVIDQMKDAGIPPDVFTFNTLMDKAQNYESARIVIDQMRDAGFAPDAVSFNTLMAKAQNYESAKAVIDQMKDAGVAPDVFTFNTLMAKAQNYESARMVIDQMKDAGVEPDVFTFSSLFSQNLRGIDAAELLGWYWGLDYHPEGPMEACIASYRRAGEIEQALAVSLRYPHLAAARKVMRSHPDAALRRFREVVDQLPSDGDGNYGLGLLLVDLGEAPKAVSHLEAALSDAKGRKMQRRADHLERILGDLRRQSNQNA